MQSKRMIAMCGAIAVLCFSSDVRAGEGELTQVFTTQTSIASADAEGIQKFHIEPFDEKLGKLKGVAIEVGMKVNGRWQVDNTASYERKLEVGGAARLTLSVFDSTELFAMTGSSSEYLVLAPNGSPLSSVFGLAGPSTATEVFSASGSWSMKLGGGPQWTRGANPDGVPMHIALTGRVTEDALLDSDLRAVGQAVIRVTYAYEFETPAVVEKDDTKVSFDSARARREDALLA